MHILGAQMKKWYESIFDELYLEIYGPQGDPYNKEEAENIMKLLGLSPGDSILDLGSGYGRHCLSLAQLGLNVTGIDISDILLKKAREEAEEHKLKIKYEHCDMRNLRYEKEFDAIINNYQSFGFFNHDENLEVFKQVSKALKPQGKFLIEQENLFND